MDSQLRGKLKRQIQAYMEKNQHLRSKRLPDGSEMKIISLLEPESTRKN
jgi:hypothetical protein